MHFLQMGDSFSKYAFPSITVPRSFKCQGRCDARSLSNTSMHARCLEIRTSWIMVQRRGIEATNTCVFYRKPNELAIFYSSQRIAHTHQAPTSRNTFSLTHYELAFPPSPASDENSTPPVFSTTEIKRFLDLPMKLWQRTPVLVPCLQRCNSLTKEIRSLSSKQIRIKS